jgi:hypothetical protein
MLEPQPSTMTVPCAAAEIRRLTRCCPQKLRRNRGGRRQAGRGRSSTVLEYQKGKAHTSRRERERER